MPNAWSDKDERMYKHIKSGEKKLGKSSKRAAEIAARTVNKNRRKAGRTPNKTTQGTGNPNTSLDQRTLPELRNRASQLRIEGRSKMNKMALITAIRNV